MATVKYIVNEVDNFDYSTRSEIELKDKVLVGPLSINNTYNPEVDVIDLHFYTLDGELLKSQLDYRKEAQTGLSAGAGKAGASNIEVNPSEDAITNGFRNGDVLLTYNFISDLFSNEKIAKRFYIEEISADRTEIRLLTLELTDEELVSKVDLIKAKLQNNAYFYDFKLDFGKNNIHTVVNIDTQSYKNTVSLILKLYEPLPNVWGNKDLCRVLETIADTVSFAVTTENVPDVITVPNLKGPNFDVELDKENNNPTEFFNYDELFSYPVTSSYYSLFSLFNEKSAQISIDHTDYSDFIHFSSAEERLRNFKYKLDLIHSYEDSVNTVKGTGYQKIGISGSVEYYQGLIEGIVKNFDHYDRYLYYESGSYAWPKSNTNAPYTNQRSDSADSLTWFDKQIVSASNFDITNYDVLTNTIPSYLREDQENEPLLMFTHMLGQHFDNIWIYFKATSDKYDADNRLDFGISKDLVRSAIESFGYNLKNSNKNLGDLFSAFAGDRYNSGSSNEVINTYRQITSGSGLEYLQPMPEDNYSKEVYKRIYHNIPYLTKAKGTHRGLRALINCFGIPDGILQVRQRGGARTDGERFFLIQQEVTSSLDKIRLDNTGSIASGSTLSRYTSIVQKTQKYSDDLHDIEVGFDLSEPANKVIRLRFSSSFDYDDYVGDPRDAHSDKYEVLNRLGEEILTEGFSPWNIWQNVIEMWQGANFNWNDDIYSYREPTDFIRLVKFFDNVLFRLIKDFVPARSNVTSGVIVRSHMLNRSKAKQGAVSYTNEITTGSISVGEVSGSDGGSFGVANTSPYTTDYPQTFISPIGPVPRNITGEEPRITGEFSGSLVIATDGELNAGNPFKSQQQPNTVFSVRAFNFSLPIPLSCTVELEITKLGEFYKFTPVGQGQVKITYPSSTNYSNTTLSQSIDYNTYQYIVAHAQPNYPFFFEGWGTGSLSADPKIIYTDPTLTIYEDTHPTVDEWYAHFSTDFADYRDYVVGTIYAGATPDNQMLTGIYGSQTGVSLSYPETIAQTGSFNHAQDWSAYASMILVAHEATGTEFQFQEWQDGEGNAISTANPLTIASGSFGGTLVYNAFYANQQQEHYFTFRNFFRSANGGTDYTDDGTYQLYHKSGSAINITPGVDSINNEYYLAEEYRDTNNYYNAVYYTDVVVTGAVGNYSYTINLPEVTNPDIHRDESFYTNILNTYLYERTLNGYEQETGVTSTLPQAIP